MVFSEKFCSVIISCAHKKIFLSFYRKIVFIVLKVASFSPVNININVIILLNIFTLNNSGLGMLSKISCDNFSKFLWVDELK